MGGILLQLPVLAAASGIGQTLLDGAQGNLVPSASLGWEGFLDLRFMAESFGILLLAAGLGAVIGFHPATKRTIDQLNEADMAHVSINVRFTPESGHQNWPAFNARRS